MAVSQASSFNFLNALQSLNRDHALTDYIVDLVFKSMKITNYLRQKGMVDDVTGGQALTWTLNTTSSPNTVWYQGDQTLPISSNNGGIITAALDWKWLDDALVVLFTDTLINDGSPDAIANMVAAQIDIMKMSSVQGLASAIVNNHAALNPLAVDGLPASIDNGSYETSYAGISKTTYPIWQAPVNFNTAGGLNVLQLMQKLDIAAQVDAARPDFYATNQLAYATIVNTLTSLDRYIQPDLARTTGSTDVAFNGCPLFLDSNIGTGVASPQTGVAGTGGFIHGLNSRYLKLVQHPRATFELEEWQKAQSNNTYFTRLHWGGNLVNLKPPAHWTLWAFGS